MTYDLYKKFGDQRLLDTPICGADPSATCTAILLCTYFLTDCSCERTCALCLTAACVSMQHRILCMRHLAGRIACFAILVTGDALRCRLYFCAAVLFAPIAVPVESRDSLLLFAGVSRIFFL